MNISFSVNGDVATDPRDLNGNKILTSGIERIPARVLKTDFDIRLNGVGDIIDPRLTARAELYGLGERVLCRTNEGIRESGD